MKNVFNYPIHFYVFAFFIMLSSPSYSQYYEWANANQTYAYGNCGSFTTTDMHNNGYLIGIGKSCLLCSEPYVECYDPAGQNEGMYKISLFDIIGNEWNNTKNISETGSVIEISTGSLPTGMYHMVVLGNGLKNTRNITVIN